MARWSACLWRRAPLAAAPKPRPGVRSARAPGAEVGALRLQAVRLRASVRAAGGPPRVHIAFTRYPAPRMARLSQVFTGKDRVFFDLFEEAAANVVRGADLLDQMLAHYPDRADLARDIVICEQEGDRITHDVHQRLNSTFVTPIDREDVLRLISDLDDIIDLIDEVADYLGLYKIEAPMEQSQRLAHVLLQATRQISEAMPRLRAFGAISHYTVEVNRLENEGDRISRDAIASLFESGIDPLVVIRWKDIFERLEEAIDACEHVANTLEGIVIKNS
jgi:predicted phosphate transport protein (TIGR00153 family)